MTMMTHRRTLSEFRRSEPIALSLIQRDAIRQAYPNIGIAPAVGRIDQFHLTPDQRVGMVCVPDLTIEIRPKFPMHSVLFLIGYASDAINWYDNLAEYGSESEFSDVLALMFAGLVMQTTRRGLLAGYQTKEEALTAPRGRILFDEQIRRRAGFSLPIEVRHDDYTTDILENRLLLSALSLLGRLPLRSERTRREVARALRLFGGVTHVRYQCDRVPDVQYTRLNDHYRGAISLASLIILSMSLDLGVNSSRARAFLVDMNLVFEKFIRKALRSQLQLDETLFPDRPPPLYLDLGGQVLVRPDLCVTCGSHVLWIGDAKYKRLPPGAYHNADLYQLLAYATITGLPRGTLIYAADAGKKSETYTVRNFGKTLRVTSVDLSDSPPSLRNQVKLIAKEIRLSLPDLFDTVVPHET